MSTLLKGLFKRLAATDCIRTSDFLALDPIKQDFVIREAFRRTLVNDCLVVFDAPVEESLEKAPDHENETHARETHGRETRETRGPRSTLGPIDDDDLDGSASTMHTGDEMKELDADDSKSVARSVARSVVGSVVRSVVRGVTKSPDSKSVARTVVDRTERIDRLESQSIAPSVAPRVLQGLQGRSEHSASHVSSASQATGVSSTSVRVPLNVRKVKIEPEV